MVKFISYSLDTIGFCESNKNMSFDLYQLAFFIETSCLNNKKVNITPEKDTPLIYQLIIKDEYLEVSNGHVHKFSQKLYSLGVSEVADDLLVTFERAALKMLIKEYNQFIQGKLDKNHSEAKVSLDNFWEVF